MSNIDKINMIFDLDLKSEFDINTHKKCNNENCLNPIKLKSEFYKGSSSRDGLQYQCKDCKKRYNLEHKQHSKEYNQQYFQDNKDRLMIISTEWRNNNLDKNREIHNNYVSRNLEKLAANCSIRRARLLKAFPKWANLKEIKEIYAESKRLSISTGIDHHVDHIIPLQGKLVCGLHVENNLQILTAIENWYKGPSFDIEIDADNKEFEDIDLLLQEEDIV